MSESEITRTPRAPYYAVIFTSIRTEGDNGYDAMSDKMFAMASQMEGFIGAESVRHPDGFGMTVCYWQTLEGIKRWKQDAEHQLAQQMGRDKWYRQYKTRICLVQEDYGTDLFD
jgi:heme-degrading monooxygenase HmoA